MSANGIWLGREDDGRDAICQSTRQMLDCLQLDIPLCRKIYSQIVSDYKNLGPEIKPTKNEKKRLYKGEKTGNRSFQQLRSILFPLEQLDCRSGRVSRSKKGRRLFSPFTQLKSDFRAAISVEGDALASVDMRACQPTLLALLAKDEAFYRDCIHDRLYEAIREELGVDRDTAKMAYCEYAYGGIRSKNSKSQAAFAIQELIADRYPTTAKFVNEARKDGDYRRLSHRMMKFESELFVDGVLSELHGRNIFALSVHDGLYCKSSQLLAVREITQSHLTAAVQKHLQIDTPPILCVEPHSNPSQQNIHTYKTHGHT
ncbi:hypothetical protein [Rubinisphaera sp. JC750]|uniref:hypothetical protein n=1 Tax=Rubinisphaera sp. JC750 TaxID=2898658 RepID=UPI001F18FAE9|nr:hypothetical protein [Rubinisphaera sp. JC750]